MDRISRPLLIMVAVLGGLLVRPTDARAGLLDFIWDMSGPQMAGGVVRCRVGVPGGATTCNVFGIPTTEARDVVNERQIWLALEGAIYTSTGKNSEGINFRAWRTQMLAFDPLVEAASVATGRVRVFHGAGATLQFLFGDEFRRFGKAGFKVRPIGVEFGDHWEAALNVRLYPRGFGADQFGFGAPPVGTRPSERTWGVLFGYKY